MRPHLKSSLAASILLVWLVPSMCIGTEPLPSIIDPDAYAVYSAILPLVPMVNKGHAARYVIAVETHAFRMCLEPDADYRPLMQGAIDSYVAENEKPHRVQALFTLDLPYELQSTRIMHDFEWEMTLQLQAAQSPGAKAHERSTRVSFEERFPGAEGIVELSAVGFNSDKTIAIVSMYYACGPLCGGAGFHVLQLRGGAWVPLEWKGRSCSMIS